MICAWEMRLELSCLLGEKTVSWSTSIAVYHSVWFVNSYGIARRTWKWTKKLFFHLTDMTILNAFLIHKSCGGKMTQKQFREILVREIIMHSKDENVTATGISRGRPSSAASQLCRLEVKHWPAKGKRRRCPLCSLKKKTRKSVCFCTKCDVGLCIFPCFKIWHTKVNLFHYEIHSSHWDCVIARPRIYIAKCDTGMCRLSVFRRDMCV
jgi:hypothetical protein